MRRFFVEERNIAEGEIIIDDRDDLHHMSRVLRLKPGDMVDISDLQQWEYRGSILSVTSEQARIRILDKQRFAREPRIQVTLFQGIPKQGKMDGIIQKTVELGVFSIVPVFTARTVVEEKGDFSKKTQRWQKISAEAVKQCKRGIVPQVSPAMTFSRMIDFLSHEDGHTPEDGHGCFDLILFPYEEEEHRTIKQTLGGIAEGCQKIAVIIGPEGGFSQEEAQQLRDIGAACVSLGKTILRTETAGVVTLAMVMYELEL